MNALMGPSEPDFQGLTANITKLDGDVKGKLSKIIVKKGLFDAEFSQSFKKEFTSKYIDVATEAISILSSDMQTHTSEQMQEYIV